MVLILFAIILLNINIKKQSNGGICMDIKNVINQYYDMVHKIAYSKTQNVNDADDLTQEVFLKYLQSDKSLIVMNILRIG